MNSNMSKILIVDDADSHLYLMQSLLSTEGYDVKIANDAQKAFTIIEEIKFDLILLDLMMPKVDGFQLLDRIKANKKYKKIPVIILSVRSDMKSIGCSIKKGAFDYIVKPSNIQDVKNKIKLALSNY